MNFGGPIEAEDAGLLCVPIRAFPPMNFGGPIEATHMLGLAADLPNFRR